MLEVLCKLLPMAIMNFFLDVCFGKDFPNDLWVGVAIRNHRPYIAAHAESLENRFVERKVAVLRASERAVKVEQNKLFHRACGYLHNQAEVGKSQKHTPLTSRCF